jgi:hypothetical protein
MLMESSLRDSQRKYRALLVSKTGDQHAHDVEICFPRRRCGRLALARLLAAGYDGYDNPSLNGGGSSGYDAHLALATPDWPSKAESP